jgi:peptide chain release factor 2
MASIKALRSKLEPWEDVKKRVEELELLYEMAMEEGESSIEPEIQKSLEELRATTDELRLRELMSGEVDSGSAFLTLHAGAGGTEACDWASMLYRMYVRWAERKGFGVELIDLLEAEGGIKSVTAQISGSYVYGHLKGESGIHRLVRISPFDAAKRRHTSFASVYVFPVIDDSVEVDIKPEDLRVDTYRAGGAGGQHVNKTDSAVRITHIPTGIVVQCQNERSQHKNKAFAMSILKSKLYEHYRKEKEKESQRFAQEKKEISWGNQIRSYVFQPYTMAKDHRTKAEVGNIQAVMDGDIDVFIQAYLNAAYEGRPLVAEEADDGD